ncbi:MAG TPA: hypothetical protein VHZ24_11465 [Pirellulales bacterium]|jgi:hypothetical protein|nr:hypothetical protein [Pirellulales bacterium]
MKAVRLAMLAVVCSAMFIGCAEKSSSTKKETSSTPGGTTTQTSETTVEKSGKNPPATP